MAVSKFRVTLAQQIEFLSSKIEASNSEQERQQLTNQRGVLIAEFLRIQEEFEYIGRHYTAFHLKPENRSEDDRYLSESEGRLLGLSRFATEMSREQYSELLEKLVDNKEESEVRYTLSRWETWTNMATGYFRLLDPLKNHRFLLSRSNPFASDGNFTKHGLAQFLERLADPNFSFVSYVEDLEQQTNLFFDDSASNPIPDCTFPLFQHDDIVEKWLEVERNKHCRVDALIAAGFNDIERANKWRAGVQGLLGSRFCQNAGKAYWDFIKNNCQEFDQYPIDLNSAIFTNSQMYMREEIGRGAAFARSNGFSQEYSNILTTPAKTVRPEFYSTYNGEKHLLKNTQILFWRYKGSDPDAIAVNPVDALRFGMGSIGIIYTDDSGRPTINKPDFLQQAQVQVQLQYDPALDELCLIEKFDGRLEEGTGNPFVKTWGAYDDIDHLEILRGISDSDSDIHRSSPTDIASLNASELGITTEGVLSVDLTDLDIANVSGVVASKTFGFMVLPLGYGSIRIKDLAKIASAKSCSAIATKEFVAESTDAIELPMTIRQLGREINGDISEIKSLLRELDNTNLYHRANLQIISDVTEWVEKNRKHAFFDAPYYTPDLDRYDDERLKDIFAYKKLAESLRIAHGEIEKLLFSAVVPDKLGDGTSYERRFKSDKKSKRGALDRLVACFNRVNEYYTGDAANMLSAWYKVQESFDGFSVPSDLESQAYEKLGIDKPEPVQGTDETNIYVDDLASDNPYVTDSTNASAFAWAPVKSNISGLSEPYAAIYYDYLAELFALCQRSEMMAEVPALQQLDSFLLWVNLKVAQGSKFDSLLNDYRSTYTEELRRTHENSYLIDTIYYIRSTELRSDETAVNDQIIVAPTDWIFGAFDNDGVALFKTAFVRGPGADTLLQSILELTGHSTFLNERFGTREKISFCLSTATTRLSLALRVKPEKRSAAMRMIAAAISKNQDYLIVDKALAQRVAEQAYGQQWGSRGFARFETPFKVLSGFVDMGRVLLEVYNGLRGDERAGEPTDNVFALGAERTLREALETNLYIATLGTNVVSSVNTVKYLAAVKSQEGSFSKAVKSFLSGDIDPPKVMGEGFVSTFNVADRLAIAVVALDIAKNISDFSRASNIGNESEMADAAINVTAGAAIVVGYLWRGIATRAATSVGINLIPGVGSALYLFGNALFVGQIIFKAWWAMKGESWLYGESYSVFKEDWSALRNGYTDDYVFPEYQDDRFGASQELIDAMRTINEVQAFTRIDLFRHVLSVLERGLLPLYLSDEIFDLYEDRPVNVDWVKMSWLALPKMIQDATIEGENIFDFIYDRNCKLFSFSQDEVKFFSRYGKTLYVRNLFGEFEEAPERSNYNGEFFVQVFKETSDVGQLYEYIPLDDYEDDVIQEASARNAILMFHSIYEKATSGHSNEDVSSMVDLVWKPLVKAEYLADLTKYDYENLNGLPVGLSEIRPGKVGYVPKWFFVNEFIDIWQRRVMLDAVGQDLS